MRIPMLLALGLVTLTNSNAESQSNLIAGWASDEYSHLLELYQHFHANPELSFQEEKTAARLAEELQQAGFEVTTGVGGHGVVAVMKNGSGPTVLVRSDIDALPVKEETGLPYASTVMAKDDAGKDVPVMHACGHDIHMTCLVGAARVLSKCKDQWRGTLVMIGQPAEERVAGARAMLKDGLFTRFPRPDYCIALHDSADLAAGTIGYTAGFATANADAVDITVRGIGGHGARPETAKDSIVLASQIVLALQTIVSRELKAGTPAVVTVGSIHGGLKHNIIPDEVKLQLTVRSYADEVRTQILKAIERIARGQAVAAGLPENLMPTVVVHDEFAPSGYNDPKLTARLVGVFQTWFGETNVIEQPPVMGGEDFAEYGRTDPRIPICLFTIGGVKRDVFADAKRDGKPLISLHSAFWAPDPEPTLKTGITAMSAPVLELMKR
jgi:amidohydrolase